MQSRLIYMEMELSHKEFIDHALSKKFDPRVLAFLEFQKSKLHVFKPDHSDRTFPCPRTWEFASKLLQADPDVGVKLLAGTVGEGVGIEFHTFIKIFKNLPSYGKLCSNPPGTAVPSDPGTSYALVMMMIDKFTEASFPDAMRYAKHLSPEFQVVYFRASAGGPPNSSATQTSSTRAST